MIVAVLRTTELLARFGHDYKRNGTTTFFAVLNTIEGEIIGRCVARDRHQELIGLPRQDRACRRSREDQPRHCRQLRDEVEPGWPKIHVGPYALYSDIVSLGDGFFSKLKRQSIQRGVLRSVDDLNRTITRYVANANKDPRPLSRC